VEPSVGLLTLQRSGGRVRSRHETARHGKLLDGSASEEVGVEKDDVRDAIAAARLAAPGWERANALIACAFRVPNGAGALLRDAANAAAAISDGVDRARTLIEIGAAHGHLRLDARESLSRAHDAIGEVTDPLARDWLRRRVAVMQAAQRLCDDAIATARSCEDVEVRWQALEDVVDAEAATRGGIRPRFSFHWDTWMGQWPFWPANDAAREMYGDDPVSPDTLGLPAGISNEIALAMEWYDTSLNLDDPREAGPWDDAEHRRFSTVSRRIFEVCQRLLNDRVDLIYRAD